LEEKEIFLCHYIQTGPPSLSSGYKEFLTLGIKWPVHEADYPHPPSAEVMNV